MEAVVDNPNFTSSENGVLFSLARHADNVTGECFPSADMIHRDSGLSKAVIWKRLKDLQRARLIIRGKRKRGNFYTLDLDSIKSYSKPTRTQSSPVAIKSGSNQVHQDGLNQVHVPRLDQVHEAVTEAVTEAVNILEAHPWVGVFLENDRFKMPKLDWVLEIEKEYPDVNLTLVAHDCLRWLETNTKGKKRKGFGGSFSTFLANDKKDRAKGSQPQQTGYQRPRRVEVHERAAYENRDF